MLDSLDKEIERRGHKFAWCADDCTILVKSQRAGERVHHRVGQHLQNRLKLVVNATKSHVVKTNESKFMGLTFRAERIQWHPKTLLKFKQQVRRLTNRNWGVSIWIIGFDAGVRMAYWRKPRTKVRNLMKLGVRVQSAVACGITSKGPWRSSKNSRNTAGIIHVYLKYQGLYALRDGWIKLHPFQVKRPVRSRMQGVVGAEG